METERDFLTFPGVADTVAEIIHRKYCWTICPRSCRWSLGQPGALTRRSSAPPPSSPPRAPRSRSRPSRGFPSYDGDLESERGISAPVTELKDRIAAASGLLIVTPACNNSMPGVLKNAIDWLTRPPKDIFGDKPVAILRATPGRGGTRLAQSAWLPVLRTLGTRAWAGKQLYVTGAGQVFDPEGKLVDEKIKKLLSDFMAGFVKFVGAT